MTWGERDGTKTRYVNFHKAKKTRSAHGENKDGTRVKTPVTKLRGTTLPYFSTCKLLFTSGLNLRMATVGGYRFTVSRRYLQPFVGPVIFAFL